jgi:protein-S-isoprenylcysteine O-methyltransferase Ste14
MMEVSMEEKSGEHPFSDTGQLILLGVFLVVWIGDSIFLHTSTFLSDDVPLYIRLIALGLLLGVAVYLMRSGHAVVDHEQGADRVVTSGAFRYVRHPLYLGSMLAYLGLAVSTASLFSLVALAGMFIFYDYIASYEERLLAARYGEAYAEYKRSTGKWVPRITKNG